MDSSDTVKLTLALSAGLGLGFIVGIMVARRRRPLAPAMRLTHTEVCIVT